MSGLFGVETLEVSAFAVGALILLLLVAVYALHLGRGVLIKMGSIQIDLGTLDKQLQCVNKAVNNVAEGEPTLIQRVTAMDARLAKSAEVLDNTLIRVENLDDRVSTLEATVGIPSR